MGIGLCATSATFSIEGGAGKDVVDDLRRRNRTVTTTAAINPRRAMDVNAMDGSRRWLSGRSEDVVETVEQVQLLR